MLNLWIYASAHQSETVKHQKWHHGDEKRTKIEENLFQLIIEKSPSPSWEAAAIKIIHLSHTQSPIKSGLRARELFCFRIAIQWRTSSTRSSRERCSRKFIALLFVFICSIYTLNLYVCVFLIRDVFYLLRFNLLISKATKKEQKLKQIN